MVTVTTALITRPEAGAPSAETVIMSPTIGRTVMGISMITVPDTAGVRMR